MTDTAPSSGNPAPPAAVVAAPRRRRWPLVVGVMLVLLAALLVTAEVLSRSIVAGVVRDSVIEHLDLPADQQLDVTTAGLVVPQLLSGRLDTLELSSDAVTLGGITGAAHVEARGVAVRGAGLDTASATMRIHADQFAVLLAGSELPVERVRVSEPHVTLAGALSLLGYPVPVALTVEPAADAGELLLTPIALEVGEVRWDAADVAGRWGAAGEQLSQTRRVCIADRLPRGVTLTGLRVIGDEVVVDVDIAGAITTDPALQRHGTCP